MGASSDRKHRSWIVATTSAPKPLVMGASWLTINLPVLLTDDSTVSASHGRIVCKCNEFCVDTVLFVRQVTRSLKDSQLTTPSNHSHIITRANNFGLSQRYLVVTGRNLFDCCPIQGLNADSHGVKGGGGLNLNVLQNNCVRGNHEFVIFSIVGHSP
jgi:hypothetical protein